MSTRSFIGKQAEDGSIRAIYCHYDGYIDGGAGEILFKHYQDPAKIDALLDGGDISGLGSRIDAPEGHTFANPAEDCTVFYKRDGGEKDVSVSTYFSKAGFLREAYETSAVYAYLYANGEWLCARRGNKQLTPLALVVADSKVSS